MPYTLKTGRIHVKDPVTGEYGQFDVSAEPIVDAALSGSSENPVQNKAVKAALDEKQTKPSAAGTAGQMYGLDGNLNPVWKTPYPLNYELLVDITLEEDTDDLVITRDSNDDEISVKELFVECDFEAAGATSYLLATWRNASGYWKDFPTGQMLSEDAQTCFYWLQRRGNIVQAYATRPYWWDATSSNANYYYNRVEESETIRGINLYKYSSSAQPIPAGSRIRIWGVRA